MFEKKVRTYGPLFKKDLSLEDHHVAGIFGNFAVETGRFKYLQELNPVVPGSRGGYGWAQWTGPRRREYEAWCVMKGLDPSSDEANYGFVVHELKNTESKALRMLKLTKTPKTAAETFCVHYERPGIPHMAKRIEYAEEAYKYLTSFQGQTQVEEEVQKYESFFSVIINFITKLFRRK